ncbi:hypothetical protein KCMC57_up38750 [Kitasatospora sp. CMC57]|uniref:DUF2142 domain-containing protein n=1 Tax=Kitasatospora sp. CMC57 TaxID=3231513 RepID=A0AB33K1B7_9ACTN
MSSYSPPSVPQSSPSAPGSNRRRAQGRKRQSFRRSWWTAFIGFFLLCAGWALAGPYDASPDEAQHIVRAAGVARGEFAPKPEAADMGTGAFQNIPKSLVRQNCWYFEPSKSAACAEAPGGDQQVERVATRAGRYNPVYYAVVGWPLNPWPNWVGVTLARLINAALVAALLASAAYSAVAWTRHRVMAAGVLAAVTPMTIHLAGSVNPNSVEIAAGAALFAALIPTLLDPEAPLRRAAMVQIGIAGSVLVTLRALGPLWCLVIFAVMLIPTKRERIAQLLRSVAFRWAAGVVFVTAVAGAAWTVAMRVAELGSLAAPPKMTFAQGIRQEVIVRWPDYVVQMIGVPSWLDTYLPGSAYHLWLLALGCLLLLAMACGRWVDRWRMFAVFAAAFGATTLSDVIGAHKYGFVAQGRYMLPVMVGLPILAAFVLGRREILNEARSASLVRAFALLLLPLQLAFLAYTMVRWQSGLGSSLTYTPLNPLAGSWHPPTGSATALLAAAVGCLLLGVWAWNGSRPANTPPQEVAAGS